MSRNTEAPDADFLAEALKRYERGYERERDNIDEAFVDLAFRAGDQWPAEAKRAREADSRPCLTVNRIPQFVRQVTGDIRMMRPSIKVVPIDDRGDQETAEILSGMIRYIENRSDAPGAYNIAADSQVTAGIGHWRVLTEYADDSTFNQELRIQAIDDGVSVIWDPDAVLPTRQDARFCFVPIDMSRAAFKAAYPDQSPQDWDDKSSPEGWVSEDVIRVAEYWEKRPIKRLLLLGRDGAIDDLTDDEDAEAKLAAAKVNGARVEKRDGWCLYRSVIAAGAVLEQPEKWPGRMIPIIPVVGEEVRIGRRLIRHGIVRYARDPQRMYNYAVSTETEVVALQPKAPFMATEKQVKKFMPLYETANNINHPVLLYEADQGAPGAPQRAQPPVGSSGLAEMIGRTSDEMKAVIGIYDAGLGNRSNETSGKAIYARQRESDVGTYVYIDNFNRAVRHTGAVLLDLIPHIYDTERVIRIIGEDGKVDVVPINQRLMQEHAQPPEDGTIAALPKVQNDVTVGAYDVVMSTGPSFTTRREEAREGMAAFMQAAPNAATLVLDLFAKAQDWPMADKIAERLRAVLPPQVQALEAEEDGKPMPQQPEDPLAAAKAQMEMQNAQLEIEGKALDNDKKRVDIAKSVAEPPPPAGPDPAQIVEAIRQIAAQVMAQGQQIDAIVQIISGPPPMPDMAPDMGPDFVPPEPEFPQAPPVM